LQQIFHVTKYYLMELKNEEYCGQIVCLSPDMKITSKERPKSKQSCSSLKIDSKQSYETKHGQIDI